MIWTNKGHQFDEIGLKVQEKTTSCYLWGAGEKGKEIMEEYGDDLNVLGFIDSDETKEGTLYCGVPVFSPTILKTKPSDYIVITSVHCEQEILKVAKGDGYVPRQNIIYFRMFEFLFSLYREGKLYSRKIVTSITDFCTLRCEKCSALTPYIPKREHRSVERIMADLDSYFQYVDYSEILSILGGDVVCHPQLNEILIKICEKYYKTHIDSIEIFCNAVIPLPEEVVETIRRYDLLVHVTDYKEQTKGKQKIEALQTQLTTQKMRLLKQPVKFAVDISTPWQDRGYPQESNGVPQEELADFANSCFDFENIYLQDKKLYLCGHVYWSGRIAYTQEVPTDYLDLTQTEERSKKEIFEYLFGYNEKGYFSACYKCNGRANINELLVPPGVQLKTP